MLKIVTFDQSLVYDLTHLGKIFFDQVEWVTTPEVEGPCLAVSQVEGGVKVSLTVAGEEIFSREMILDKNLVKGEAYEALSLVKASRSPYGILVGVRPVKLVHQLFDEALDRNQVEDRLMTTFKVAPHKARLLTEIALRERPYVKRDLDKISVYVGIPFCPSICTYCAFPSNDLKKKPHLLAPYMARLNEEISYTADLLKKHGLVVDNLYVGGGTPSVLDEVLLEEFLKVLNRSFDLDRIGEFTFEAGRADTITREKLRLMKAHGVTRVCLNPQSMDREVLARINRGHEPEEIRRAMTLIRETGFDSVNMDLIAGLPGDSARGFIASLKEVVSMGPDNITLHTLSIKKSASLDRQDLMATEEIAEALAYSSEYLEDRGFTPYYLYRQKNILGNFENIGYALTGKESPYNIRMMEEQHPILALGVGGVSKKIHSKNHFDRVQNFRSVEEYLSRFQEVLDKKAFILNLTPED